MVRTTPERAASWTVPILDIAPIWADCARTTTSRARIGFGRRAGTPGDLSRVDRRRAGVSGLREPGTGRRRLGVESGAGSSTILLAFAAEAVPERRDGEPAEDTVEDVGAVRRRRARQPEQSPHRPRARRRRGPPRRFAKLAGRHPAARGLPESPVANRRVAPRARRGPGSRQRVRPGRERRVPGRRGEGHLRLNTRE